MTGTHYPPTVFRVSKFLLALEKGLAEICFLGGFDTPIGKFGNRAPPR